MAFAIILGLFILQRLTELFVSRRNEKWLLERGAVEYGKRHYPLLLILHTAFVLSVIGEYFCFPGKTIAYPFLVAFVCLLIAKLWVINALGHYWNTKIYRIPGSVPVHNGAYKYFKHPNYAIVIAEIIVFPLIFHLYYTAIIFTVLNAAVLYVRINTENSVWSR